MGTLSRSVMLLACSLLLSGRAPAQPCEPHWSDEFRMGGLTTPATCAVHFDDGSGDAVYVGGTYALPQVIPVAPPFGVAKWNGRQWQTLPPIGPQAVAVSALTTIDDGTGTALFAAAAYGSWPQTTGLVSKWNGVSWSTIGTLDSGVLALAVGDVGDGRKLYATGYFRTVNGVSANSIASWDGTTWSPVGTGLLNTNTNGITVGNALSTFHRDGREVLVAGGGFTSAGGSPATGLAVWDGHAWSALGSNAFLYGVNSIYEDRSSPNAELFVAGSFGLFQGAPGEKVARWDGSQWSPLGSGPELAPLYIGRVDFGTGPKIVVGGTPYQWLGAPSVNVWDGQQWTQPSSQPDAAVRAMVPWNDDLGPGVMLLGDFRNIGDRVVRYNLIWRQEEFSTLADLGADSEVSRIKAFRINGDPVVFAHGYFQRFDGQPMAHNAMWANGAWTPVPSSLTDFEVINTNGVECVVAVAGMTMYGLVAGTWQVLFVSPGTGVVVSLVKGPDNVLYGLGWFGASGVARLVGTTWVPLSGSPFVNGVTCAAVFDAGQGPQLFVGGYDYLTRVVGDHLEVVANVTYSVEGGTAAAHIDDLFVHDDGRGPALYVGGYFNHVGTAQVMSLVRWSGTSWEGVGISDPSDVLSMCTFDDGTGPALIVGGAVGLSGTQLSFLAKWNGHAWSTFGGGCNAQVHSIAPFDDGRGMALWVGGGFTRVGSAVDSGRIARWVACPLPCYANCDQSVAAPYLNVNDLMCFINRFAVGDSYANCDGSTMPPVLNAADFACFLNAYATGCP